MKTTLTEGALFSGLFFLVSIPVATVPLFLGLRGAPFLGLVCFALLLIIAWVGAQKALAFHPIRWKLLALTTVASILLCVLGGEGHFFYANSDWLYRDAVLNDLARQPWPVIYHFQDQDWLLRAPLGMYMLPALVEKLSGYPVAEFALLVQSVAMFSLIFYFLIPTGSSRRAAIIIITVFCVFGGWHIAAFMIRFFTTPEFSSPVSFFELVTNPQVHIDWWASFYFQYPAAISQIFWVPNHAIPGWVFACLYLRWLRSEVSIGLVLASVPILAFWSPLAALGMVPFAAYAGIKSVIGRRLIITDILIVVMGIAASAPTLFYERLEAGSVPHGFQITAPFFWLLYLFFVSFMVLPFLGLTWWARERQKTIYDLTILIAATLLILMPLYHFGIWNDFVTRGSIPALAILAAILGLQCATIKARNVWKGFAVVTLVLGAVTGALEINRAFVLAANPPLECNLIQIWQMYDPELPLTHYIASANAVPSWAMTTSTTAAATEASTICPRKKQVSP